MSIDSEIAIMQQSPIFQGVEPARLRVLAMTADHVQFNPGEIMVHEGSRCEEVLFILAGRAHAAGGFELHTLIGSVSAFLNIPYITTVIADTKVDALRMPVREFLDLVCHCNQISLAVMKELSRIIQRMTLPDQQDPNPVIRVPEHAGSRAWEMPDGSLHD